MRFQGQYYDEELGLNYNRYRYYDPEICAFVSQDPLGLEAGSNVYRYAPNVWGWVDPWGLSCSRAKPRIETGNLKEGWIHIEARHITGTHPDGPGDLFAAGTTRDQLTLAAELLVKKGNRISDPSRRIQTMQKRIKINGRRDLVRVIVDCHDNNRVISIFPVN